MKVPVPKPPPKNVKHEILGLGEFVKTHPLGKISHIRKGPTSRDYNFRRKYKHGREGI